MDLHQLTGQTFGGYDMVRVLHQSGSGSTYEARKGDDTFAIKVFPEGLAGSEREAALEFQKRLALARKVVSERLVRILSVDEEGDNLFVVQEFVPGRTLRDLLDESSPLEWSRAVEFTRQILQALVAVQDAGLVHGEIQPTSILVTQDGSIKLAGLGLAKDLLEKADLFQPEFSSEPLHFRPPEQVSTGDADTRSDIYSVGAVTYAMLTGVPPHVHASPLGLRMLISNVKPDPVLSKNPDVPEAVSDFVGKMLEKKPQNRFADAEEALETLHKFPGFDRHTRLRPAVETAQEKSAQPAEDVSDPVDETASDRPSGGILSAFFLGDDVPEPEDDSDASGLALLEQALSSKSEPKPETGASPDDPVDDGNEFEAPDLPKEAIIAEAIRAEDEAAEEPVSPESAETDASESTETDEPAAEEASSEQGGILAGALFGDDATSSEADDEPHPPETDTAAQAPGATEEPEPETAAPAVDQERFATLVSSAREALEKSDFEVAVSHARQAADLDPDAPEARELLADAEDKRGEYLEKKAEFERLSESGDMIETERVARDLLALNSQDEKAKALLDSLDGLRLKRREKKEADKLVLRAHRAMMRGEFDNARDLVSQAEQLDPERPDIPHVRADIDKAEATGASPETLAAEQSAQPEPQSEPAQPPASDVEDLLERAHFSWERGKTAAAEALLEQALQKDPEHRLGLALRDEIAQARQDAETKITRGHEFLSHGQFQLAKDTFQEVLHRFPGHDGATSGLDDVNAAIERSLKGGLGKWIGVAAAVLVLLGVAGAAGVWFVNKSALDKAAAALDKGDLASARASLDGTTDFLVDADRKASLEQRLATAGKGGRHGPTPAGQEPGSTGPVVVSPWKTTLIQVDSYLGMQDWQKALNAIDVARRQGAPDPEIGPRRRSAEVGLALDRGRQAAAAGKIADALSAFREVAAHDSEKGRTAIDGLFKSRVDALSSQREARPEAWAKSLADLGELFDRKTDVTVTIAAEADGRLSAGDYPQAEKLFAWLEQLAPNEGHWERAREAGYRRLLDEGRSLEEKGDLDGALKKYEEAAKIGLDDRAAGLVHATQVRILKDRASAFEESGELAQALDLYDKVLEKEPDDTEIKQRRKRLESRLAYRSALAAMEKAYGQKDFAAADGAAREALKTGQDDGYAALAHHYLAPLSGMRRIEGGTFRIGDDGGRSRERPAHGVTVKAFYIDAREVTVAQYGAFLDTLEQPSLRTPPDWESQLAHPEFPVVNVSLADATAFAAYHRLELPTEAEWEIAARGDDGRVWPWGGEFVPGGVNTFESGSGGPVSVADSAKDESPNGCFDMAGNVAEWTVSPYAPYPGSELAFPEGKVVIRGGDFSFNRRYARCASRRGVDPTARKNFIGFRCVRRELVATLLELE